MRTSLFQAGANNLFHDYSISPVRQAAISLGRWLGIADLPPVGAIIQGRCSLNGSHLLVHRDSADRSR
jgi:hypothetical protein